MKDNAREVWKPVRGYEKLYSVSNMGRIRCDIDKRSSKKGKILKISTFSRGYKGVGLFNGSNKKNYTVHKIVCEAFISKYPRNMQINHKNRIKSDNRLINLEYVTPKENVLHSFKVGTRNTNKGELNGMSKLNRNKIFDIRKMYKTCNFTHKNISILFNISRTNITNIINKKAWKYL